MRCWLLVVALLFSSQCEKQTFEPSESAVTNSPYVQEDSTLVREAPGFGLATLAGDSLRLSSLRGRVVVINFWATWCVPCLRGNA